MTTKNKKPTHRVYNVTERGEGKDDYWQPIGAAWAHEDGNGFNLSLDYLPLKPGRIVVRTKSAEPPTARQQQDDEEIPY
jgi:hypothetical protein